MARMIDADNLFVHYTEKEQQEYGNDFEGGVLFACDAISKNAHTVDAVAVIHATLEDMGLAEDDREWVCSNCKAEFTLCVCGKDRTRYIQYCPYCGAMIIGERKGGDE